MKMSKLFDFITDFIFVDTDLQRADVILVPGGSHPQPIERAAELYHLGLAPCILPSGGYNAKLDAVEWDYMCRLAVDRGVPEKAILEEKQASNTFDNARNSWAVLSKLNIEIQKVILVCKAQHSRRALLTYKTVFPEKVHFMVSGVVDGRQISKDNWYLDQGKIDVVMKEVEKIGNYFGRHISKWTGADKSGTDD